MGDGEGRGGGGEEGRKEEGFIRVTVGQRVNARRCWVTTDQGERGKAGREV